MIYYFQNSTAKKLIKIRELMPQESPLELEQIDNIEKEYWSASFDTEQIEDLQTAFASWPLPGEEYVEETSISSLGRKTKRE